LNKYFLRFKFSLSVIGIVGLPANYGGFETLAENLVKRISLEYNLEVYCSASNYSIKPKFYNDVILHYIPFKANGFQSLIYDCISTLHACFIRKSNYLLVLGVSGAYIFPIIRLFTDAKIVVNVDGIESRRAKWGGFAKLSLRMLEFLAVKFANIVVADNEEIVKYIEHKYNKKSELIEYGGDIDFVECSFSSSGVPSLPFKFVNNYYYAICRIEPENNIHIILDAFQNSSRNLIFIGNWQHSKYSRDLYLRYSNINNIQLLNPIFNKIHLHHFRSNSIGYIHGHSAGGTNPSLVEALQYDSPIFAFDCSFNRATLTNSEFYFRSSDDLNSILNLHYSSRVDPSIRSVLRKRYSWNRIADKYKVLFK
jgi:hypothetical protein